MRKCNWILMLLVGTQLSLGQSANIVQAHDSLMKLLPTLKADTTRIDVLKEIGKTWISRDPAKALQYVNESIALARKIKDTHRVKLGLLNLGYQYNVYGESGKAIETLQETCRLAQKDLDSHTAMVAVAFISTAYVKQGDLENALHYAWFPYFYFQRHYPANLAYLEPFIGSTMNVGEIYLHKGRLDSALYYMQRSYTTLKKNIPTNRYFIFHIPMLMGEIHLKLQNKKQALFFINEGLKKAYELSDNTGIVEGHLNLANYYLQVNQPDSVRRNALLVIEQAWKLKKYEAVSEAGLLLKTWYTEHKNPEKALYYSDLASAAKDSLTNFEKVKQGQQLRFREQQYQRDLANAQIDYQNRLVRYWLIAGLGIVLLIVVALYLNNRRKQKDNLLLKNEIKLQEAEFASKIAETEMTALRAQMNPHFIFNCLNSIKLYTLENDAQTASDYLTKFSRLIRLVLENSRSEKVTLANELETLQLYIEMEAMRFKNKVKYQLEVDDEIDIHYIDIPPLLLQPYIENAIWHGLMHKEEGGTVIIKIDLEQEHLLQVSIIDDGIGRAAAAELKSKSATKNKSFGLKMTSERIELINQLYKSKTQVQIEDLVDDNGNTKGTKVIVKIPV